MDNKKSFVMYTSWAKLIENLDDIKAGTLIKAVCSHVNGHEVKIEDETIRAIYSMIEEKINEDAEKYSEVVEKRKEAIKKRWEKNTKEQKTNTSEYKCIQVDSDTVSDTVTDTDTESVSDTVTDTVSPTEINKYKSIPRKTSSDPRHPFGEYRHVRLSDKEYEKLVNEYGQEQTDKAITFFDEYIEYKGYKCKNYYLAMKKWVFNAMNEKKSNEADDYLLKVIRGEA